jgi:hypothetical protein
VNQGDVIPDRSNATDKLDAELAHHQIAFRDNRLVAHRIVDGLTLEQFNWSPAAERWSIAQCLAHLNISARLYADRMEAAICEGRDAGLLGAGPFHYGLLARMLARAVDPANHKKSRSPAKFVAPPGQTYDPRDVLQQFDAAGIRWERCLHEANGLNLARVKVRSPAAAWMRLPLGALFGIQAAHERRHLLQADAVLRQQAVR